MMKPDKKSRIRDTGAIVPGSQAYNLPNETLSSRLRDIIQARQGVSRASIARSAGISTSSLDRWVKGATPDPESALALADALSVHFRWLITGLGPRDVEPEPEVIEGRMVLAKYDLNAFAEAFRPPPTEYLSVRTDWINRITRATNRIWLADMTSSAMPSVAREGDTLVCQDIEPPVIDGHTYLFFIRTDLVIRRVQIRPDGIVLRCDDSTIDPIVVGPDKVDQVTPIARVLGSISVKAV